MAREDPTFTSGDIVRIWCNNLDKREQNWVVVFFLTVVPGIMLTTRQIEDIFNIVGTIVGKRSVAIIIDLLLAFLAPMRGWLNSTWAELIFTNEDMREEVLKCIQKKLQGLPKNPE